MDIHRTKNKIREVLAASRPVRLISSAFFLLFVIIVPWSAIHYCVGLAVLLGAVVLFSSALTIFLVYLSCHRRYYPALKGELWGDIAKMLLCPPTALRACDLIMRKLSAQLDLLPVAVLLLRGTIRKTFLSEYIADLESPDIPDGLPSDVRDACLWQTQAILKTGVKENSAIRLFSRGIPSL